MPVIDNNDPDLSIPSAVQSPSPSTNQVVSKKRKIHTSTARGVANLTPEQLEKKRANDREAQRAIRERTKAQIETLEKRIQELTSQQPYQDLQAVLREKEAAQNENEAIKTRLVTALSIIQDIVGAHGLTEPTLAARGTHYPLHNAHTSQSEPSDKTPIHTPETPWTNARDQGRSQNTSLPQWAIPPTQHASDSTWLQPSDIHHQRKDQDYIVDPSHSGGRFMLNSISDNHEQYATRIPPIRSGPTDIPTTPISMSGMPGDIGPSSTHITYSPGPGVAHWSITCKNTSPTCLVDNILLDFLRSRQHEASNGVALAQVLGTSRPSMAPLLNPYASQHSTDFNPISQLMADILSKFPGVAGLPEKIGVLYMLHTMMRWQIHPSKENYELLPDFLCPRPSQIFIPHPIWLDYMPWPRMRDKIIENHTAYPFEDHWILLSATLSLNWPYSDTDCLLDTSTNAAPTAAVINNLRRQPHSTPAPPSKTTPTSLSTHLSFSPTPSPAAAPATTTTTTTTPPKNPAPTGGGAQSPRAPHSPTSATDSTSAPTPTTTTSSLPPSSDTIVISPAFERHVRDLRNWSLGPAYAKAHPSLAGVEGVRIS